MRFSLQEPRVITRVGGGAGHALAPPPIVIQKMGEFDMNVPEIVGLFPTPLAIFRNVFCEKEICDIRRFLFSAKLRPNGKSPDLLHTDIFGQEVPEAMAKPRTALIPHLTLFGGIMFGQQLEWKITGIWGNIGKKGACQPRHSHSNSIVSGIVYLDEMDKESTTRFHKSHGGLEYCFENHNDAVDYSSFNATTWSPDRAGAGDVIMFPSYLLHEVLEIKCDARITVAFNAVPGELDCSGYVVRFA